MACQASASSIANEGEREPVLQAVSSRANRGNRIFMGWILRCMGRPNSAPQLRRNAIAELLELGQFSIGQIHLIAQVVCQATRFDLPLQLAPRFGQADAFLPLVLAGDGTGQPTLALQPLGDG